MNAHIASPQPTEPKPNPQEVAAQIMAKSLHELNPSRSEEEWLDHVKKYANDPKGFWGSNGEGLAEYEAFTSTYDVDKHKREQQKRKRKGV